MVFYANIWNEVELYYQADKGQLEAKRESETIFKKIFQSYFHLPCKYTAHLYCCFISQ